MNYLGEFFHRYFPNFATFAFFAGDIANFGRGLAAPSPGRLTPSSSATGPGCIRNPSGLQYVSKPCAPRFAPLKRTLPSFNGASSRLRAG